MAKNNSYDVIIVGAGPGGLFCALEIVRSNPNKKVLIVEMGERIEDRKCLANATKKCLHCSICNNMSGVAGAGAFSDGKFHYYPEFLKDIVVGGNLQKHIGIDSTKKYAFAVHEYLTEFGATNDIEGLNNPEETEKIKRDVESIPGLTFPITPVKHVGTEQCRDVVFKQIQQYLMDSPNVTIMTRTNVTELIVEDGCIKGVVCDSKYKALSGVYYAPKVVMAVGRSGATSYVEMCKKYGINSAPGTVDIGVRIEIPREVLEKPCKSLYELKVYAKTPGYHDTVRTFCMNDGGYVSAECTDGITCANGHAEKNNKTSNTNFALLVSIDFLDIEKPMEYMEAIGKVSNILGHGNVLAQRLGDIRKNLKRTWPAELSRNSIKPTLEAAETGDLAFAIPRRILRDLIEAIEMLDKVFPGIAGDDTIWYFPEIKAYGSTPKYEYPERLETNIVGLHAIGDGCGLTRGLVQAAASGVCVGTYLATH